MVLDLLKEIYHCHLHMPDHSRENDQSVYWQSQGCQTSVLVDVTVDEIPQEDPFQSDTPVFAYQIADRKSVE